MKIKEKKPISLERIPPYALQINLENFQNKIGYKITHSRIKNPQEIFVSSSEIPGAAAAYNPITKTIITRSDLIYKNPDLSIFARAHELAHHFYYTSGTPEGEFKTDIYAANQTGKFEYIREFSKQNSRKTFY